MSGATVTEQNIIIIKKKKVSGGGGHHGGAWKVAYADFVTAMMAFFLLLSLLNATTEQQRKGLADYFSPTIPLHRARAIAKKTLTKNLAAIGRAATDASLRRQKPLRKSTMQLPLA